MRRVSFALAVLAALLSVTPAAADWPTYHGDNSRQGNDAIDQGLNAPTVGWASAHLDGQVYGQPVVVGGSVVAATENNTVYSLSTTTGLVQWSRHLGAPRTDAFPCGNIRPLGITGTPVIDGGNVFVVAEIEDTATSYHFELDTLALSDGTLARRVNMNPGNRNGINFDANYQQQRGALTLSGGQAVMVLGGLAGDCTNPNNNTDGYRGYVISYPELGSGALQWWSSASLDPTDMEGSIWAPGGASIDANGNIFVATGNSNHGGSADPYDYSDGVIKLSSSNLSVLDYFAPSGLSDATHGGGPTWYQDNANDADLGSSTPLQLAHNRVFQVGKSGMGYLLDTTNLGHVGGGLASHRVCSATNDAAFGSLAAAVVGGVETVFVGCSDGIQAVQIASSDSNFANAWHNTAQASDKPPVVAGSLVWAVSRTGGTLYGYNEATGAMVQSFSITGSNHFTSPTATNNMIFVEGGDQVDAFLGAQSAAVNGFTMDAYGGVYHFGSVSAVTSPPGPYWPGWKIARGLAVLSNHSGGYMLDGFGGVHAFGSAPALDDPWYWANWDIARAVVVNGNGGGYLLDGFGGVHALGNAPAVTTTAYWPNWDIAHALVLRSDGHSGWVMDGFGGLHGFGTSGDIPGNPSSAYWPNWDIARSVALVSDSGGYVLDGFGGVHNWGTAPAISNGSYWANWDIARSISIYQASPAAGYLLDGFGGIHPLGAAVPNPSPGYTPGSDRFRVIGVTS